jgi:hypothetical protein
MTRDVSGDAADPRPAGLNLRVPYRSGWFTVVLPTLEFFAVWWGLFVLVLALAHWDLPGWAGALAFFLPLPVALALCVPTYRLFCLLAQRGRGVVTLSGDRLRWRAGWRWHKIDLARPHHAAVAAGASGLGLRNASITLSPGMQLFHLRGAHRDDVLRVFPEPHFIDELAVLPEEGSWGFDLEKGDPTAECFFFALLERLWANRRQNARYRLFQRFPWDRRPQPAFDHIRVIDHDQRTPEEDALLRALEQQFVDGLADSYVRLTPDYLVGYVYRSAHSQLSGAPDFYCLMPLGHVSAEVSLPRPDWKPFLVGHVLKQAVAAALATQAPSGGPYLENRRYLLVRGRGADGQPLELAFQWYDTVDKQWEEAEFLVRFVQAARLGR